MDLDPSQEFESRSICQEISCPLWNPKVYYWAHKNPYSVNWIQSTSSQTIYLNSIPISILTCHLHQCLPHDFYTSGFLTKVLYALLIAPMCVACFAHLIFCNLISIIFDSEYKLWSCSLCNFLHSLINISLWVSNILLSILFSDTLNIFSSLSIKAPFHMKVKQEKWFGFTCLR